MWLIEKIKNAHKVLVENPEGNRSLDCSGTGHRPVTGSCEHDNDLRVSGKMRLGEQLPLCYENPKFLDIKSVIT